MGGSTGLLHNLSEEIQSKGGGNDHWFAHSSHYVAAASPPRAAPHRAGTSRSDSATPSPSKDRRQAPPRLDCWTVRVCQMISTDERRGDRGNGGDDSETESDEEEPQSAGPAPVVSAWYSARLSAAQASQLTEQSGETSWQTLELRIRVAWDKGSIDVLAVQGERATDGSYPAVKLALDAEEGGEDGFEARARVEVQLVRLHGVEEIRAASIVSAELVRAYNALKGRTNSLVEERESHRRLLQNNRRHERLREANSSLVNPGRLKRKTQDDEGFEGDDE